MHILLTDILACPRCGPTFGLILLANELSERQVVSGHLGCPNCRQSYPISAGVVDLRYIGDAPSPSAVPVQSDPERAYRTAALLGVTTANANLLILDAGGSLPAGIAEILPQAHIIGASGDVAPREGEEGFVSRVLVDAVLPFRNSCMRGVAFAGVFSSALAREALRVLMPGARLVIDSAAGQVADELRTLGFRVELEQDRVVVAAAPAPG